LRLKVLLPAFLVPLIAAGALVSGIMPVAGNAVLQDAQDALNGAIDQVGDTVGDIVDQVQDTPSEPTPVVTEPAVTDPPEDAASDEAVTEVQRDLIDIPGYMPGTANGVALLQTTRVNSPTHQGWVDITLDLMLTSLIPEEKIRPGTSLNATVLSPVSQPLRDSKTAWGSNGEPKSSSRRRSSPTLSHRRCGPRAKDDHGRSYLRFLPTPRSRALYTGTIECC